MFWGDAGLHTIEMANLDGTERRLLWNTSTSRYFGMALDPTFLYFTDWDTRQATLFIYYYRIAELSSLLKASNANNIYSTSLSKTLKR
jgi:hypothetical protein